MPHLREQVIAQFNNLGATQNLFMSYLIDVYLFC
jgi:hypothetical protein